MGFLLELVGREVGESREDGARSVKREVNGRIRTAGETYDETPHDTAHVAHADHESDAHGAFGRAGEVVDCPCWEISLASVHCVLATCTKSTC